MEWSDAKTHQLIELYEKIQYFMTTTQNYHNRVAKFQAWDEISKECGIPGLEFRFVTPDISNFTESLLFVLLKRRSAGDCIKL